MSAARSVNQTRLSRLAAVPKPCLSALVQSALPPGAPGARSRASAGAVASSAVTSPIAMPRTIAENLTAPGLPELRVSTFVRKQFVMCALLDDPAVFEHDDPVRCPGLREPVRDHQCGAAVEDAAGGALERARAGAAGFGSGLVEDRHRRVVQSEPGERDLLRLGGGQRMAALADVRVEQLVAPARAGTVERGLELLVRRVRLRQPQVGRERA